MNASLLTIPRKAGRIIVESGALFARPLLGTDQFVRFCRDCGLTIDRERLIRLERIGLIAPVFRVRTPKKKSAEPFYIPPRAGNNWFTKRWAYDTTAVPVKHTVPSHGDSSQEGYYSVYQVYCLVDILNEMTLHLMLDSYLDRADPESTAWKKEGSRWLSYARAKSKARRSHQHRRAVALLCQHISNRYFPQVQTDMRTFTLPIKPLSSNRWIIVLGNEWDWYDEREQWDPKQTERTYSLTPKRLRQAYEGLAIAQAHCDPIEKWYQLTQFISVAERKKLKRDALRAETLRTGAHMLSLLYKDLYGDELPHPNEVMGSVRNHFPELEIRKDVRRYLEFVSNRFGLNPQPRLSLFVEGKSEEVAVLYIFDEYLGTHPGVYGIEIIVLGGVDAATGNRDDRFRAIMRLVDYLHDHQTFAFLILDNERYARRLKSHSRRMASIHSTRRYVTRPEYIRIWRHSFEFDNFSNTEIAAALNELADGSGILTRTEVKVARSQSESGSALKKLYSEKTGNRLDKIQLTKILIAKMLSPSTKRRISNRPIVKILERVTKLAALNHLPTTQRSREENQRSRFLGTKRGP